MRTVFDRRVRKLGLTRAQWLALTRLHRRPGASQSELADMMEVEKATAGRLIDRLEAKGWVERRAQAGDRRINRVYLTTEAERVHKRIWRIAEATVDDALVRPLAAGGRPAPQASGPRQVQADRDCRQSRPATQSEERRPRRDPRQEQAGRSPGRCGRRAGRPMTMASLRLLRPRAFPATFDWRRNMRPILLIAVPALVIIAALTFWLQGGRYASTENAYVKADIAQIASEVQGRIAELTIRDHATVAQGEVLVRLDPEPYRLALAKAEAELDSARSAVEQLKVSLRESKAEHKEAESRMLYLEVQAKRQHDLAERGVSPATKIELADSEALQARDRVSMLRERIARVEAALGGNPERPTDSYAAVREKMALRDRAALDLAYTEIKAPRAGVVVNFKLQPGEQIKAQTPLFSIVSDRRPWVEANFKETDLTNVVVGQKATVVLDIYPDITWDAEVESISPATGAEFAILPPQNASGNWVKVVQRLPVRLRLIERPGEPAAARRHDGVGQHRHAALAQPVQHLRRRYGGSCQAVMPNVLSLATGCPRLAAVARARDRTAGGGGRSRRARLATTAAPAR